MKCVDAMRSLEDAQREFASRYLRWCVLESARERDGGFARLRRFPSSPSLRFLDFVESLQGEQAHDLMVANLKFHFGVTTGRADAPMTQTQTELRQRFLGMRSPPRIVQGQLLEPAYVSPREQDLMRRDLDGETRLWEPMDRKTLIAILREHLDPVLGKPVRRASTVLEYCAPVGYWYVHTQIDLGGREQLTCSQSIQARRKRDLCTCALASNINLLAWCGVHPSMRTHLIEASRLNEIAVLLRELFTYVLQEAPAWLVGLAHAIPDEIEDADTWLGARLATRVPGKE